MHVKRLKIFYVVFYVALFSQVFVGRAKSYFGAVGGCRWNGSNELSRSLPILEFLDVILPDLGDSMFAAFANLVGGLFAYKQDELHVVFKNNNPKQKQPGFLGA